MSFRNQNEIKRASALYFFATFFNKGIAFITVPIFTRILSTSDYGMVTTYNSWVSILSAVFSMSLFMGIRVSFIDYSEDTDNFLSTVITFTCLMGTMMFALSGVIIVVLPYNSNITLVLLCGIQGFAAAILNDYTYFLMMKFSYKARTLLMILPNLLSVTFSVLAIIYFVENQKYMGRIIPTALIYAIFGVCVLILVFRKAKPQLNWVYLRYALMISLPLVLHSIALNILSQSDRTMITMLRSSAETGIYSLVYNFSMIATVITTAMEGIWVPWFTNKLQNRETDSINKMAADYVHFMTYILFCLTLVGPELLKLLSEPSYWEGISIIPPIIITNYLIFLYTFYVNVEHFHKKSIYITINTMISAVANIILNFIFIPRYGYLAAAFTTLGSYILAFLLHARFAKRLEQTIFPLSMFRRSLLHISLVILIFYVTVDNWGVRWGIAIIYFLIMFCLERKRIGEIFPGIARRIAFFR